MIEPVNHRRSSAKDKNAQIALNRPAVITIIAGAIVDLKIRFEPCRGL